MENCPEAGPVSDVPVTRTGSVADAGRLITMVVSLVPRLATLRPKSTRYGAWSWGRVPLPKTRVRIVPVPVSISRSALRAPAAVGAKANSTSSAAPGASIIAAGTETMSKSERSPDASLTLRMASGVVPVLRTTVPALSTPLRTMTVPMSTSLPVAVPPTMEKVASETSSARRRPPTFHIRAVKSVEAVMTDVPF